MSQSMMEKTKNYLKQNLGYFVIALACIIYVARGIITISETGKTVLEILVDGALALFFGIFINIVFELQGMMSGDRDDRVLNTIRKHGDIVDSISPHIDKLDEWCEKKNKEALKLARIRMLSSHGLKYDDYFDEDGVAKEFKINTEKLESQNKETKQQEKDRIKCFKNACKIKLTLLTTNSLTSEGGRDYDPYYLGQTKKQYKTRTAMTDFISKIGVAVIFGVYGAQLVQSFSWAFLVWTAIQVVLFLIMGVVKLYTSYMFVVDDYRGRIVKKIDNLTKFQDYITNSNKEESQTKTHEEKEIKEEENVDGKQEL